MRPPKRFIAATLAVAGLIALPMPASVSADECKKGFKIDKVYKKPYCPPPPPPPGS
jgi:hypothetical protein